MRNARYEVVIWFDSAPRPQDIGDRMPSHTEKQEVETEEEVREYIDEAINVDNLEESGIELDDGRKEYGYWGYKSRGENSKPYIWATVEVRKVKKEVEDISEVL